MGREKPILALCLLALVLSTGCVKTLRSVGLAPKPDLEWRKGPGGDVANPETLSPFKTYRLVMAGDECRFFKVRVPSQWYWKLVVTASAETEGLEAEVTAAFDLQGEGWEPLVPFENHKTFSVAQASSQAAIAVANTGVDRMLTLRLCQKGTPVKVVLSSQVSAFGEVLLAPPVFRERDERP